jgi:mannosyl-oligosaccharide alpha-1,2-mannosidase
MGLSEHFDEAVAAVVGIDFGQSAQGSVNAFEINTHYLGGLLAAYDLSKRDVFLAKAVELGDFLYAAPTPRTICLWFSSTSKRPRRAKDWSRRV